METDSQRGRFPASDKGKGEDGESKQERKQYLLSSFYVPGTVLSAQHTLLSSPQPSEEGLLCMATRGRNRHRSEVTFSCKQSDRMGLQLYLTPQAVLLTMNHVSREQRF